MTSADQMAKGRILSANMQECTAAYRTAEERIPAFGSLVRIPMSLPKIEIYAIVIDIRIEEDGFLRQISTAEEISAEIMEDTRQNRNIPVIVRLLYLGYTERNEIVHLLPPRPPMTLDDIYLCNAMDIVRFTAHGSFGYLRHILRVVDAPAGELIAAHLRQAAAAQAQEGNHQWIHAAVNEVITLMRDDYQGLTNTLCALGDADIS